jgi:hypothetical protein
VDGIHASSARETLASTAAAPGSSLLCSLTEYMYQLVLALMTPVPLCCCPQFAFATVDAAAPENANPQPSPEVRQQHAIHSLTFFSAVAQCCCEPASYSRVVCSSSLLIVMAGPPAV